MSHLDSSTIEDLLSQYAAGAETPEGDPTTWLLARTALEEQRSALDEAQARRLATADRSLVRNAAEVRIPAGAAADHPRSEWWWYPDVVAQALPRAAAVSEAPRGRWRSVVFSGLEAVVLLVVLFLVLRNLGVSPFAISPTATPTASSTPTALPTATAYPTYTLYPTFTLPATATASRTFTSVPTATAYPTYTLFPTYTLPATATAYPTYTPFQTNTLPATATPSRTFTPPPTATAYPTNTPRPTITPTVTATNVMVDF